ncbi:MAG: LysO family transporter [Bacillota bacterium]
MWPILIALAAGFLFGCIPGAHRLQKANRIVSTVALFCMLTGMGVELGGDQKVMASLSTIGLAGALIAAAAILGSLLVMRSLLPALQQVYATQDEDGGER